MSEPAKMLVQLTADELDARIEAAVVRALAGRHAANDDGLLPTADAAKLLGRSPKALLRLVSRGKIKPDVWGRRGKGATHLFSRATLDAFREG